MPKHQQTHKTPTEALAATKDGFDLRLTQREYLILHWAMSNVAHAEMEMMQIETKHKIINDKIEEEELEILLLKLDWAYDKITEELD